MKIKLTIGVVAATILCYGLATIRAEHDHEHEHEHEHEHHHEHEHEHEHHHAHAHDREVEVSASARELLGIKTVKVSERNLDETIDLWGRYELSPSARFSAVSPVFGKVSLNVRNRQMVQKGDVLFTIDSPDLRTRAAELAVLEQRLDGITRSGAKNAALAADIELRKAELVALVESVAGASDVVPVRAAAAGQVVGLVACEGSTVEKGGVVIELVDPSDLHLVARVPPADRLRLKDGMPVRVGESEGVLELSVANSSEVYVTFSRPDANRRVGELAKGVCRLSTGRAARVVPSEAVVLIGVTPTVFIKDEEDEDCFVAFAVEVGRRSGGWTEILNFPEGDEEVVVRGQYELKLALDAKSGSGAKKSVHFHADGRVHEGED